MSRELATFAGRFAVWQYTIGHGRLLLRRTKSPTMNTRTDVLFKDVGWLCLPMALENLSIEEVPMDEAAQMLAEAGSPRSKGRKLFRLSGDTWRGYVLAGSVAWKEDELEYDDPTALLE